MPDAKPMSPERLAEIERILCSNATWWREHAVELVAEVRRLRAETDGIAAIRDAIFQDPVIVQSPLVEFVQWLDDNLVLSRENEDRLGARIAALETGLREAIGRWEYPSPTHADKARKDELWQLLQADNTTKETK